MNTCDNSQDDDMRSNIVGLVNWASPGKARPKMPESGNTARLGAMDVAMPNVWSVMVHTPPSTGSVTLSCGRRHSPRRRNRPSTAYSARGRTCSKKTGQTGSYRHMYDFR